jgi:hemolysin activation/secretion protein
MNKFLTLLTFIAASTGIYFAFDAIYEPSKPAAVVMPQDAASSPAEDEEDEEEIVEETQKPAAPVASAAVVPSQIVRKLRASEVVKPADVKLIIREIKFDGVTAFSHDELKGVVSEFVGQELTVEQAMAIPAKITKHYQDHNLVARATLVGSLARDGLVKVGVIETQVKQAQLDKELTALAVVAPKLEAPKIEVPQVEAPKVEVPLSAVAVSNVAKLEVRDDASVVARFAEMSPSIPVPEPKQGGKLTDEQETEFILKRYAKSSRQYELLADNYGYAATGRGRVGAGLVWNDALLHDDKFSFQGLKSQGSHYMQAAYEWATGVEGLKLGANFSAFNYDVVNGLQTAVNLSGDAIKKGVLVAIDLANNPSEVSTLGLHYDVKKLNTTAVTYADSAYYDTKVMGIQFKGMAREMAPGGSVFTYDAMVSSGNVDMNGSPNKAADLSGEQTGGAFSKLRFNGTILQPLSGINAMFGGLTIQRANKNLDGSEKIYLGGPMGVRAYGVGEGMGSDGELATFELRHKLSAGTTLSEFYDWGHVRPWHNGSASGAPVVNTAILQGYGLSLASKFESGITLKGTWAHRLGNDANTAAMPRGHDGQYDRNRFWMSLESRF